MKGYQQLSFKGDAYGKTQQQSRPETLEILCISALVTKAGRDHLLRGLDMSTPQFLS